MSTGASPVADTTTMSETRPADTTDHEEHHHVSDWEYVKIALILAVITAVEVFTYFESVVDWGPALVPSLIIMMILKFWLVLAWFMHLKFDKPIFRQLFYAGLALATVVYLVTLLAFEFFG
jgi:cytochrome c oxidase subunit IV